MGQHAIDGRTQTGDPGAPGGGGDAGVVALVKRKDTSGAEVANMEYTVLHVDATGALKVTGGIPFEGGHVNYNVDDAFTGVEVGGLPLTVDENDTFQPFRSEAGNLKVTVEGGTGGNTSIELGTAATTTPATASASDYVIPSDTDRLNLIIQNQSETDPIYISATATPGAGLMVKPEGSASFSRSPSAEYHVSTAGPDVSIVWFAEVA